MRRIWEPSLGEPLLDAWARLDLCAALCALARVEVGHPPRDWALRAGFSVTMVRALPGDEAENPNAISYVPHEVEGEVSLRTYCGLSRGYMRRRCIEHTWTDVWLFALDLAVPPAWHKLGPERLIRRQPHCPEDVIRDVLAGRWRGAKRGAEVR
jgi:hypothetical protein